MDNKKFEQLIDLIINEQTEQARDLFHDIVVQKSREIYESLMEDDIDGLMGEVEADEMGDTDEFGDEQFGDEQQPGDELDIDLDDEDFGGDESESEELEDRVVDLEDKLDELMAEFEELMAGEENEEENFPGIHDEEGAGEDEFGGEEGGEDFGGEDEFGGEDDQLDESVELSKVKGLYDTKIGGDDGAYTKSPALSKPKVIQTGAKPVGFSQGDEKGRTAPTVKTNPGQYKNQIGVKKQDGETAPKPQTAQATGTNTKSPVAESKRTTRPVAKTATTKRQYR